MAASAPQGGGGAYGAEGGHTVPFGNFDDTAAVPDINLGSGPLDNIIQRVDVTTVANDEANDRDYDDPYPGGKSDGVTIPLRGVV